MKFVSDIYHPNIYPDGKVCISILHPPGNDPLGKIDHFYNILLFYRGKRASHLKTLLLFPRIWNECRAMESCAISWEDFTFSDVYGTSSQIWWISSLIRMKYVSFYRNFLLSFRLQSRTSTVLPMLMQLKCTGTTGEASGKWLISMSESLWIFLMKRLSVMTMMKRNLHELIWNICPFFKRIHTTIMN